MTGAPGATLTVRLADTHERDTWVQTAQEGWSEFPEVREFMASFGPVSAGAEDSYPFLALDGTTPIATGMLWMHGNVALLAGATGGSAFLLLAARGIDVIAVDPAYTSKWGAQHWQKPLAAHYRTLNPAWFDALKI